MQILQTLGRLAEAEEGNRRAITVYAKAAVDSPKVPEFREDLAGFYFGLSDFLKGPVRSKEAEQEYRKGVAIYEKLAADFPKLPNYRKEMAHHLGMLGNLLKANGQPAEAVKSHQQAVDIRRKLATEYPKDPSYRKDLAHQYSRLSELLQANKQSPEAQQAFRQSVDVLEKLAAEFPNVVGYRWELASAYKKTGEKTKALAELTKVIELEPLNPAGWHLRGFAYAEFGQLEKAIADYSKALELAPQSAVLCNNLAWLLATCPEPKFRDSKRAVELAKKAVELAPKEGNHWNTLGVAHYRAGEWKDGIDALKKSDELLKGDLFNFNAFFLAMAHWQLSEKDEAHKWYGRAIAWMEKNQTKDEELRRFRAEATELLGIKDKK